MFDRLYKTVSKVIQERHGTYETAEQKMKDRKFFEIGHAYRVLVSDLTLVFIPAYRQLLCEHGESSRRRKVHLRILGPAYPDSASSGKVLRLPAKIGQEAQSRQRS